MSALPKRGLWALGAGAIAREDVRIVSDDGVRPFRELPQLLRAGDLLVVNDAATLPGSLRGTTADGEPIELRLSGPVDGTVLEGVLFGAGDHRTRTEDRAPPPPLAAGARIQLGVIAATVTAAHGRRVQLAADRSGDALWQALYAAGAPVQYAHRAAPLALWTVQTAYAARPWAAEMPSAGRALTWDILLALRRAGIAIARLTHAAGLSSTGDAALDAALPWPERYDIPVETTAAIAAARRVIAVGTTVVRALEASCGEPGPGVATLRIDMRTERRVVDGLISGLHVPGESHFELLTAFASPSRLRALLASAAAHDLSAHELGDACLVVAT
jgi:S-adenosylmethionine:tRNA ribosyltransferase-isomerase